MSKIIGKYEFEDVTNDYESFSKYGYIIIPFTIFYRHKYWYMWEFEFMFWKWSKRIEITRTDWKEHPERDEKVFWKRLKKLIKNDK